jgi:hypothetical protein
MKTILRPSGEQYFLKDALRDLVVVVVGILAALYLESAWQDHLDRKEEQQILVGLKQEFQVNRNDLHALMANWRRTQGRGAELHSLMGGPVNEETVAKFNDIYGRSNPTGSSERFFFDPRYGQLTSVINSGKLGLVENSELRSLIADWPAMVDDHDFDENLWIEFELNAGQLEAQYQHTWPDSRFELRTGELMQDRIYDNGLGFSQNLMGRIINEGQEILNTTGRIIALIDAELEDSR